MPIEIKNRWTQETLFTSEGASTTREAMVEAVGRAANLSAANLRAANLSDANLSDADLSDADLSDANLSDANLSDADLSDANLSDANLSDADLSDADLSDANLSDADLSDADLSDANLRDAIGLTEAQLRSARTNRAKSDLWGVFGSVPNEVAGLRAELLAGRVDGSTYQGDCSCLVGTVAKVRHCEYDAMPELRPDMSRPAERWFLAIRKGDTPDNSPVAKITLEWIDEWTTNMQAAFGPKVVPDAGK